jgi:hypothetical protein
MKILDRYHAPIRVLDWIVALFLVVVIVFLHVSFMQNAGGLWRDEVSTINLAILPRLTDVFEALVLYSFPLSGFLMLRVSKSSYSFGHRPGKYCGVYPPMNVEKDFYHLRH